MPDDPAATTASFAQGELVIASTGDRIPEKDILFIKSDSDGDSNGDTVVGWLRDTGDTERPFVFGSAKLDNASRIASEIFPKDLLQRTALKETPSFLRTVEAIGQLHVVVSTRSGLGQAHVCFEDVLRPLLAVFGFVPAEEKEEQGKGGGNSQRKKTYHLLVTTSTHSISAFAQTLHPSDTVLLLSGDGGVVDLLNGVSSSSSSSSSSSAALPTVATLPLGTGNALFHSLHKPASVADTTASPLLLGLRTLLHGRPVPLPIFEAIFSPGSHTVRYTVDDDTTATRLVEQNESVELLRGAIVASYGFHAQLVWESDTPDYRQHGAKRFGMAAEKLLVESHAYSAGITTKPPLEQEQQSKDGKYSYILATLVSNLEKTFTISPASKPLDGQLRLVHFGAVDGVETMEIMKAAYNDGSHVGLPEVGYDAIDELEVRVREKDGRWRKVCIDGTIVEIPQDGWMRVRKAARPVLRVLIDL